uniref:Uncharacterized protein n=1 Tax=Chlorocebus sabaeus TaxID=60711 RepID=A0A0D9SDS2_CHLSB
TGPLIQLLIGDVLFQLPIWNQERKN